MAGKYRIDEDKLFQGVSNSLSKALSLANDAESLLKNIESFNHALGLYGFAIEEYGKAISLLESKKLNTKYEVSIGIFNGQSAHNRKFGIAVRDLPSICKDFRSFFEIKANTSSRTQTFHGMDGESVSYASGETGIKEDITHEGFFMSRKTRERCFYEDWDNNIEDWVSPLPIKINRLRSAIKEFRNHIRINFY